ncbi:Ppx/GppA family phosphatase [Bacillus salacetis]|uniref:Ppx/GppA family phosphatase n=1 Tax=Bacillus salacetis TaxID=2315464 RepID=A0A3A1QWJ6_9BACI|nr:Ppx/GppA phosphatase family protein [Bacillus salacetis]RIW29516.1 Ppx/GppA family phosphatase [Bacillus salacetis]
MSNKSAIIDIGSNTIRLVIYEHYKKGRYKEIENVKAVARLRTFLDGDMKLAAEGIDKLMNILKGFMEVLDFHEIPNVRCVATATIRQAENKEEVLTIIKKETGMDIEILSEEQEAYYGFLAVISTTPADTALTIDIGGGSTEITYFENRKLIHSHSYPFGVVSLKQRFIQGDSITEEERSTLTDFLLSEFSRLPWLKNRRVPIIGVGGSARNIAQIDQQQKDYELSGVHQYVLSGTAISSILEQLFPLSYKEIEKVEGLSKDRADIILPAAEVFNQLFSYTDACYFMISRKGLRDGLVIEMANEESGVEMSRDSVIRRSLEELCHEFDINDLHSKQMKFLASTLTGSLSDLGYLDLTHEDFKMLQYSAALYYLGEYIDSDSSSQHTFYILANRPVNGFFHKERVMLACISSFKNKTALKQYMLPFLGWFTKEEMQKAREMGALLKLAYSLNATKRNIVQSIDIERNADRLDISVYCKGDFLAEQYQTEKQKRHLEKAIKTDLDINFSRID